MTTDDALPVLQQGDGWVVVEKPAGLLSVPGKGEANQDCVAARVMAMFPDATGPLTVHRLDMETSGVMVVALTPEAHRALSMQFEARTVNKRYVGVVGGSIAESDGVIELWHRVDLDHRPRQIIDRDRGKFAVTNWRAIERCEVGEHVRTRIEFEPITGRTHQIRVACAAPEGLGAPLIGDSLYGDLSDAIVRMLLHATMLEFTDPNSGQTIRVESPAPF